MEANIFALYRYYCGVSLTGLQLLSFLRAGSRGK